MTLEEQMVELKEAGYSRTKAAMRLGIEKWRLDALVDALKMDWPRQRQGTYVINGLRRTLEAHSKALGIEVSTIRSRLQRGIELDAPPVIAPVTPEEANAFADLRRGGMPAWEAARQMGRPYNTLKNAAKKYVPDYESIVSNASKARRNSDDIDLAS